VGEMFWARIPWVGGVGWGGGEEGGREREGGERGGGGRERGARGGAHVYACVRARFDLPPIA
jgi:hypothetical protein